MVENRNYGMYTNASDNTKKESLIFIEFPKKGNLQQQQ